MILAAGLLTTGTAHAQDIALSSAVYVERERDGSVHIEPADRFARGDRVVTIVRWDPRPGANHTITTPVPVGLALQSASHPALQISVDGGRTWRRLVDPRDVPRDTTHLRWRAGAEGRLSYRAVVR